MFRIEWLHTYEWLWLLPFDTVTNKSLNNHFYSGSLQVLNDVQVKSQFVPSLVLIWHNQKTLPNIFFFENDNVTNKTLWYLGRNFAHSTGICGSLLRLRTKCIADLVTYPCLLKLKENFLKVFSNKKPSKKYVYESEGL